MDIYCEQHPNLSKQDILFIHGNLASTQWWKPALNEWKKQGPAGDRSILLADWRGCGRNPDWPADQAFTIEDLARDFLALLHERKIDEVVLVGHSLGGLIALQMMILDPRRVARAALLDPVGARGVVFDDSTYEAFRQMAGNRELTRSVILNTVRHQEKLDEDLKEIISDGAFKAVKGIGSSVLEILKTVNLSEPARRVKTPTLILHGQEDTVIPLEDSRALADLMPNAKLEILPEAGHCWNVENPAAFVRRLREWL